MPKRKQRDYDEGSSDSPLTKAARACRDAGDTTAPAGEEGSLGDGRQDSADGVVGLRKKLHWRKVRRVNARREAKVGRDVLQTIQSSLGRAPKGIRGSWRKWRRKAAQPAVRKVRAGSYTTKFMIEMALPETTVGNGALKHEPLLPSVNKQAGMSGVSKKNDASRSASCSQCLGRCHGEMFIFAGFIGWPSESCEGFVGRDCPALLLSRGDAEVYHWQHACPSSPCSVAPPPACRR